MNKLKSSLNAYVASKEDIRSYVLNNAYKKKKHHYIMYSSLASILLVFFFYIYTYNNPDTYISLDINPSIMLTANSYEKVIDIKAMNDDAEKVIENIDVYGKSIDSVVDSILNKTIDCGYVNKDFDENAILLTTYGNNQNKNNKIQQRVHNNINDKLSKMGVTSVILDEQLDKKEANMKNGYGVSQGKILLVEQIIEENPSLSFDELIHKPTRELVKYLNQNSNKGQKNKK